ncbi:MAG: DUF177 domain-containing protein [Clostridia bacterium]|nr:DUF177 domain-containing protein [Clostridia bacterium]
MKWNVQRVFTGETSHLTIEDAIDLSKLEFQYFHPFKEPVRVTGTVNGAGSIVILRMKMEYTFHGECSRCLKPVSFQNEIEAEHILVTSTEQESDDLVVVDQFMLDLDELVEDDIWMELPSKCLCRPDCQGLCSSCGKNLNDGPCGCSGKEADPRLAALAALLD